MELILLVSRLKVLSRLNKLGIRFTSEKQHAMLRGDTSGAIIHPFFVYAAQALGMYFCEGVGDSPAMVRLRAKNVQMCSESIVGIFKSHDWVPKMQMAIWIIAGSVILRLGDSTRCYVQKCRESINTTELQFVPTYGRPPEFSEDLHEKLSALTQIIYFENFLFLTCGGVEPTTTARIEKEFRDQLPVRHPTSLSFTTLSSVFPQKVYPVLFKICPLTMRTRTILLVRDTVDLLNLRPNNGQYSFHLLPPRWSLIAPRDRQRPYLTSGNGRAID